MKAELTDLWNKADSGRAFAAAVEERGYILAKGDRRDFCIVDRAGDAHSLARRLDGVKAKDVRERMADVDRDSLPTVTEARTEQREHRSAEFWQGVEEKREASSAAKQEQWSKSRDAEIARVTDRDTKTPSLGVLNAATGAVESLGDFVLGFLGGGSSPAPAMPADQLQQIRAQRKALAALENIQDSMERGENLKPDDIKNLTPTHLENIRLRGDDYFRETHRKTHGTRTSAQDRLWEGAGTVTACRPPRGDKSDGSGERGKRGAPARAARLPLLSIFRHTAKITLARVGDFGRSQMPFLSRVVQTAMRAAARAAMQPQPRMAAIPRRPAGCARLRRSTSKPRGKGRFHGNNISPCGAGFRCSPAAHPPRRLREVVIEAERMASIGR